MSGTVIAELPTSELPKLRQRFLKPLVVKRLIEENAMYMSWHDNKRIRTKSLSLMAVSQTVGHDSTRLCRHEHGQPLHYRIRHEVDMCVLNNAVTFGRHVSVRESGDLRS